MDAKRCDLCGSFFDAFGPTNDITFPRLKKTLKVLNRLRIDWEASGGNAIGCSLDVCPTCMGRIADLIKELGDN